MKSLGSYRTLVLLLSLCFAIFIPDTAAKSVRPSQKDVGTISLQPFFHQGKSWNQKVHVVAVFRRGERGLKQVIRLKMVGKITAMNKGVPKKLVFSQVHGPQLIFSLRGTKENPREKMQNKGGTIVGDLDLHYRLINQKDLGSLSNDIFSTFPPGPFFGFLPPKNKVKVGHKWTSGDVLPLGPKSLRKRKFQFSQIKGSFQLTKLQNNIAHIVWSGAAMVKSRRSKPGSVKWQRLILFDLRKRRTVSNQGTLSMQFPNGLTRSYQISIHRK